MTTHCILRHIYIVFLGVAFFISFWDRFEWLGGWLALPILAMLVRSRVVARDI